MSQKKVMKPLLMDKLTLTEKLMLGQTSLTPGYKILLRLIESACEESRISINDADPEDEDYDRVVKARQQYSRNINQFSALVLRSVEYHTQHGVAEEQQKESEALKVVQQG